MSAGPFLAGLYARISQDADGDQLGVKRQLADGRGLVKRRGGTVVVEEVDNDISAYTGKRRPGYEALMAAVDRGDLTHIVVWQTSRLWRSRRERAEGIERLRKAGVSVIAVRGPDLDMSTAYGRGMAGLIGEFDTMESEVKSERAQRKASELAAEGRIGNGGPRPFGYRRVYGGGEGKRRKILRDELDPHEAAIVRECAERFLSGESLRSIVGALNARGVTSSTGRPWTGQAMRAMLRSGRIAGLREHQAQVIGKAVWPPIVDQDTHELLRARLDANIRPPGHRFRVHYLSGFVYCSTCAAKNLPMRAFPQHGKLKYRCPPKQEGGCNGRIVGVADMEDFVAHYVVAKLSAPAFLADLATRERSADDDVSALRNAIESDERRLELLQASLTDGDESDLPEVLATVRVVRKRLAKARDEAGRRVGVPQGARESVGVTVEEWARYSLDRKRVVLSFLVERILILPARRGLGRFDPDRVVPVPRA